MMRTDLVNSSFRLLIYFILILSLAGCSDHDNDTSNDIPVSDPRIAPLTDSEMTENQKNLAAVHEDSTGYLPNIHATLVRNESLFENWSVFETYTRRGIGISTRERAILLLRTAWRYGSGYVFALHRTDAADGGLSDAEIEDLAGSVPAGLWSETEAALIQAADELHCDAFISDDAWDILAANYTEQQMIDILFVVGEALIESWAAGGLNVQLDDGFTGFPATSSPAGACDIGTVDNSERTRLSTPRMLPVPESEWTPAQAAFMERKLPLNILLTLIRNPEAAESWWDYLARYILASSLPPREREILILRIGWLCYSAYEFGQHTAVARLMGVTDDEILNIIEGADADGWSAFDAALIRAVDELHESNTLTDATWDALKTVYSDAQMIDVVVAIGQYKLVSMLLNTLGVPLEENNAGFPEGY